MKSTDDGYIQHQWEMRRIAIYNVDSEAARVIKAGGDPWKILWIPEGADLGTFSLIQLQGFIDKLKAWQT